MTVTVEPLEDPGSGEPAAAEPLYWFQSLGDTGLRLPLSFNPSSAGQSPATVLETCRVGEGIAVAQGVDARKLGEAIHACIGLSFTDPQVLLSEAEIGTILSAFNLSAYLSPTAVLQQVAAFHEWLASRWPGAKAHAEIALQSRLPSGQVANGRIDLLLETDSGWVLIDHKSSQSATDRWEQLASEYAAQLSAYAQAVEQASGRKVAEQWLLLPVTGGALSIGFS